MSFTRLCAILFVFQLKKHTNTQFIHEFIVFVAKRIFKSMVGYEWRSDPRYLKD